MKELPSRKAAGKDGIPTEVLKLLWPEIGPAIVSLMEEIIQDKKLHPDLNRGLQSLIPKGGCRAVLGNYRPISVLPALYKLLAKVMANRVRDKLPLWIKASQTGFVKNRYILNNVFLAYEAMEWAHESKQDMIFLMIDFEKAYDRINWTFLCEAIKKMGISQEWVDRSAAFYKGATSSILVNGEATEEFELEKGVRQGCPLAPYLFLFVQDVVGHMLCDPAHGVEGISLPDSSILRESFFADDSGIFLKGTRDNMERAFKVLDLFCEGSGAKMNLSKSTAIWCSEAERDWPFGEERGLKWLPQGSTTLNLGFPIGFRVSQQ